jgi:hypothetical protein
MSAHALIGMQTMSAHALIGMQTKAASFETVPQPQPFERVVGGGARTPQQHVARQLVVQPTPTHHKILQFPAALSLINGV